MTVVELASLHQQVLWAAFLVAAAFGAWCSGPAFAPWAR
jgi:hypothetical protein